MADNLTKVGGRVLLLTGSSDAWARSNPVLLSGELGIEVTNQDQHHYNIKIGDGKTRFMDLPTIFNNLNLATKAIPGMVRIGDGVNVDNNGVITVTDFVPRTGGTIQGNLEVTGDIRASRVFNPVVNDYAEYFELSPNAPMPMAGDVIMVDKTFTQEYYTKAPINNDTMSSNVVVGVMSDSYGHIVGGRGYDNDEDYFIPVALAGRVSITVPDYMQIQVGDTLIYTRQGLEVLSIKHRNDNYTKLGTVVSTYDRKDTQKVKLLVK